MKSSGGDEGYHTVTQDRDIAIVHTERDEKIFKMLGIDKTATEFIKTGDWTPLSVHSSHINGDLLVGMIKDGEAKITRFNKAGKQTQRIQWNSKGQALYTSSHYIAENINGDICTSDYFKEAVVVVNELGTGFPIKVKVQGFVLGEFARMFSVTSWCVTESVQLFICWIKTVSSCQRY